jgi:hypothetical protein
MIVISESVNDGALSASAQDNVAMSEAAKFMGCQVYYIPKDFSVCESAENALWHIPEQETETCGLMLGFIPSVERYEAIYNEALRKRIRLLNSPDEHLTAQEFDRAYSLLVGMTPESVTISSPDQCNKAAEQLGFPLFVRGAVRSLKASGWKACVAANIEELQALAGKFFESEYRSRGRVIVRKLVELKRSRYSDEGFPLGREYRLFLYRDKILGYGYYWEGEDPLSELNPAEEKEVLSLATEAARRLNVPFVAIDIGQLTNEEWIVIEVNDAQFAGVSQIPLLSLWDAIRDIG